MSRKASGSVIPPKSKGRSWAIRFTAYGERHFVTLDPDREWDRKSAEEELANVLADVRRDIWRPESARRASAPSDAPTFQEFASEWLAPQEGRVSDGTFRQYRRTLTVHLLPHFGDMHLDEIKVQDVDRYRDAMVAKSDKRQQAIDDGDPIKSKSGQVLRPLSAYSINKSISQLSTIMELAVEYGHAPSNPASGKRRRLKAKKPQQAFVKPEQLPALLEAADELTWPTTKKGKRVEVESKYRRIARPLLATIAYAGGLRISEALALTWGDINLGSRTLYVRESKTDAGVREVEIPVEVAELLAELKASAKCQGDTEPVFTSEESRRKGEGSRSAFLTKDLARRRILKPTIKRANGLLRERGIEPIPESGMGFHGLRRTYISIRAALGDDPVWIADQVGHADRTITLNTYAKALGRRSRMTPACRKAFDQAVQTARDEEGKGKHKGSAANKVDFETSSSAAPEGRYAA